MYDDSYDNDGTDFWKGYDSSAAASPVLSSKASSSHIEYSPPRSFSLESAEPTAVSSIATAQVPELVFSHHRTSSSTPESDPQPLSTTASLDEQQQEEDDDDANYWSQYAKVQGSGDSTVPSPRLANGKKPEVDEYGRPLFEVGEDPDHQQQYAHDDDDGDDGAVEYQPTASLRGDPYVRGSIGVDEEFADAPFGRGFDDAFAEVIRDDEKTKDVDALGLKMESLTREEAPLASEASDSGSSESAGSTALSSEAALEEAMRGIYWLWKGRDEGRTVEQFLTLVRRAVEP
ncbi:hypothetical protein FRB90_005478 [Tulasnella sp. 427]|nr:hypothetical protein FRB90_005478 [Tulasnella sp. 427]